MKIVMVILPLVALRRTINNTGTEVSSICNQRSTSKGLEKTSLHYGSAAVLEKVS